jgi:5'-nucleotidase
MNWAHGGCRLRAAELITFALTPAQAPNIVVSGITKGQFRRRRDLFGTVSAAVESALLGVPAIAVSLAVFENHEFQTAAEFTAALLAHISRATIPPETL